MARWTKVAAAQLGPNQESTPRTEVVARMLALVLIGYNTPPAPLAHEQHELAMRSGAYLNSLFVVGVAKAGREDGVDLIGDSLVIDPLDPRVADEDLAVGERG